MYDQNILYVIVALAIIISFFIIAIKVSKIYDILAFFRDIELRKPENWYDIDCEKCREKIHVSMATKNAINCPHCGTVNKVVEKPI